MLWRRLLCSLLHRWSWRRWKWTATEVGEWQLLHCERCGTYWRRYR